MSPSERRSNVFLDISIPLDYCCGNPNTQKVLDETNAHIIISKWGLSEFRTRIKNWHQLINNVSRQIAFFLDDSNELGSTKSEDEFIAELFTYDKLAKLAPQGMSDETIEIITNVQAHAEEVGLEVILDELDTLSESARVLEERLDLLIIDERCASRDGGLLEAYILSYVEDDARASMIVHAVNRKQEDHRDLIYLIRNETLALRNESKISEVISNERGPESLLDFQSPTQILSKVDI